MRLALVLGLLLTLPASLHASLLSRDPVPPYAADAHSPFPMEEQTDPNASDDEFPEGDLPDGDLPDGDLPDGDQPDGDLPDGDLPDGNLPGGGFPGGGDL